MAIITPALISALKTSFQKHFQDALATAPSTYLPGCYGDSVHHRQ